MVTQHSLSTRLILLIIFVITTHCAQLLADDNQEYKSERHRKFDNQKKNLEPIAEIQKNNFEVANKELREVNDKKEALKNARESKKLRDNNELYNELNDAAVGRFEKQLTALKLTAEQDKALAGVAKMEKDLAYNALQQVKWQLDEAITLVKDAANKSLELNTVLKNKENAYVKYTAAKVEADNADLAFVEAFAKAEKSRIEAESILSLELVH